MSDTLAVVLQAERRLDRIRTLEEVRVYDGELAALEKFARAHQLPIDQSNRIVQARALVQLRGGELVAAIPDGGPGGRGKIGGKVRTLRGFHIADRSAARWLSLTKLREPEATIRDVVARRTAAGQSESSRRREHLRSGTDRRLSAAEAG